MTKLQQIETAVAALAPHELELFREWFEEFQSSRFDKRIARDADAGKLDSLAEAAVLDFKKGRAREL